MFFGRSSRLFKLLLVGLVFTLFLIAVTQKNGIKEKYYAPHIDQLNARADSEQVQPESGTQSDKVNLESNDTNKVEEVEVTTEYMFVEEGMPGAFLRNLKPIQKANKSYCKFNYGMPYDIKFKSKDIQFPPETDKKSPYRILYNVTEAWHFNGVPQVTYAGHATADFAYYIPELLRLWDGFVSIAAYVPDLDVALFLEQINQYCYCLPAMSRLSIHLVFHRYIPISKKDIYFTKPDNCLIQDSAKIRTYREFDDTVIYPVNVARNAARNASFTKYIMVSDIQLMPSQDLAQRFLEMVKILNKTKTKEVFVIPIFEVEETERIPRTKLELLELLAEKKAVYFHGMVCPHCQKFPGIENWVQTDPGNKIEPFLTIKRQDPYHRWEPIYIGTQAEPLYNEELSWDGLQDKMTQSLEMCLRDYDYTILDGCFLIHWPGIKKTKVLTNENWRIPFVEANQVAYNKMIEGFYKKYKIIPKCRIETKVKFAVSNTTDTKGAKNKKVR